MIGDVGPRTSVGAAGTLNLGDGPTSVKLQGVLQMIALGGLTILGMQEGGDRGPLLERLLKVLRHPAAAVRRMAETRAERRVIRRRLRASGWHVFRPTIPGGGSVPSAYDELEWHLLRGRTVVAVARAWVGAIGAGPTWSKPKVITVLVLRNRRTGVVVEHFNTHMVPSADRNDLPEREQRARRRHHVRHSRRLAKCVRRAERRGHGVVVTMDANATRHSDLSDPLRAVDLVGWSTFGTKGARGIDHVLTVRHGLVVGAPARPMPLDGFDHRGVVRPLYVKAA